jgi:hypothetical protein
MSHHDAVFLNSMMLGNLEHEMLQKALPSFELMRDGGMSPNERTFMLLAFKHAAVHQAIGTLCFYQIKDMDKARMIHSAVVCHGFGLDVYAGSKHPCKFLWQSCV